MVFFFVVVFFSYFSQNIGFDNLHATSKPIFWEKGQYFKFLSAEILPSVLGVKYNLSVLETARS